MTEVGDEKARLGRVGFPGKARTSADLSVFCG